MAVLPVAFAGVGRGNVHQPPFLLSPWLATLTLPLAQVRQGFGQGFVSLPRAVITRSGMKRSAV